MRTITRHAFAVIVGVAMFRTAAHAQTTKPAKSLPTATRNTLDSLVLAFDHVWEPQRGTVDEKVAAMDRLFVSDSSFVWITDGRQQSNRGQWMQSMRSSFQSAAARTDSTVHRLRWSMVHVLDENTVLHSSEYCADSWRKDGTTGVSEGTSTMLLVRTSTTWRIAAYHGSHRRRPQPLQSCPAM